MIRNSPQKRKCFYDKVWAKASRDLSKPPKPIGSSSDSGSDEEPEIIPLRDRVGEYEAEEIELTEVEALNEEEDDQYRWKVQLTSLKNGQSRSGIFQTAVKMLTLKVREQFYFDAKYLPFILMCNKYTCIV